MLVFLHVFFYLIEMAEYTVNYLFENASYAINAPAEVHQQLENGKNNENIT